MICAVLGDIIGSPFEMWKLQPKEKDLSPLFFDNLSKFTDDTVMTMATADACLTGAPYEKKYIEWFAKHPNRGYGAGFAEWAESGGKDRRDSYGNGAAMRISPLVLEVNKLNVSLKQKVQWLNDEADKTVEWTHNCEESRMGAKALLIAMLLASQKKDKDEIQAVVESVFDYDLEPSIEDVREKWPKREVRCSVTVPQALICFLKSESIVECIQNAIWTGGDCDTIASMAAAVGEHFYGLDSLPDELVIEVKNRIPDEMWEVMSKMYNGKLDKYNSPTS